ncbi:MAG: hypothetical protein IJS61_01565 [Firmicutes bacterium]|nr:hypothetical protein [Bacillota bacterium]
MYGKRRRGRKILGCSLALISVILVGVLSVMLYRNINMFLHEGDTSDVKKKTQDTTVDPIKESLRAQLKDYVPNPLKTDSTFLKEEEIYALDIFYTEKDEDKKIAYMLVSSGAYCKYKEKVYKMATVKNILKITYKQEDNKALIERVWICPKDKDVKEALKREFPQVAYDYVMKEDASKLQEDIRERVESVFSAELGEYTIEVDKFGTVILTEVKEEEEKDGSINYSTKIISQERLPQKN